MSGMLKVRLESDGDGSGELFVCFEAAGFSGRSSAWFNLALLEKNIERFLAYPLPAENFPTIEGGYWNKEDLTQLEQEHVYLSAVPKGTTGNLVLRVRVATPYENTDYSEQRFLAAGELRTTYDQLAKFVKDLKCMLHGTTEEVVFYEEEQ